jgi:hypothetical protein
MTGGAARRGTGRGIGQGLLACGVVLLATAVAVAEAPVQRFLEALRNQGYHDVVEDYLRGLQQSPYISAEIKSTIPYELAKTILENADSIRDLQSRMKELDRAAAAFQEFLNQNASHPLAGSARIDLGEVLIRRGRTLLLMAQRDTAGKRDELVAQARGLFEQALQALDGAVTEFQARFDKFPAFIDQKETALREQRRQALIDLMQAKLVAATAVREYSKVFPEGSNDRQKQLTAAATRFHEVYDKYRQRLAGLYAYLYEGQCHKELGDLNRAVGIFTELLAQPDDPEAFRILKSKALREMLDCLIAPQQKKYQAAIDQGEQWLRTAPGRLDRTPDGLAIGYYTALAAHHRIEEIAKDTMMPKANKDRETAQLRQLIVQRLRLPTQFATDELRQQARDLLAKYRTLNEPTGELKTFAEALQAGRETMDFYQLKETELGQAADESQRKQLQQERDELLRRAWDQFQLAMQLRDERTPIDEVNTARYYLAFVSYGLRQYHEAAVIGQFLARYYPTSSGARHAAKIALAAYLQLYQQAEEDQRDFEARQMVAVARLITEKWPTEPDADESWMLLGELAARQRNLDQAAQYFDKIPASSPRKALAELKAGQALYAAYVDALRQDPRPAAAQLDELLASARQRMSSGVQAMRKELGDAPAPYDLLASELSLAQIHLSQGNPEQALALLTAPGGVLEAAAHPPQGARENFAQEAYKAALRGYVALSDTQGARQMIDKLNKLVPAGGDARAQLTRIYLSLGVDLERQIQETTDPAKRQKLVAGFETLLSEISSSAEGNTFDSLGWVASMFFSLGSAINAAGDQQQARRYFQQAATAYEKLLAMPEGQEEKTQRSLLVQLARCKRNMGTREDMTAAVKIFLDLIAANPNLLEAQKEVCYTFEQWADVLKEPQFYEHAISGYWSAKSQKTLNWGWFGMANRLVGYEQFRSHYYEARYNVAQCRFKLALTQQGAQRTKTLQQALDDIRWTYNFGDRSLGGDALRNKFDVLARRIQGELGQQQVGLRAFQQQPAATTPTATR